MCICVAVNMYDMYVLCCALADVGVVVGVAMYIACDCNTHIAQVYEISLRSKHCQEVHRLLPIECICAFAPGEEGVKLRYVRGT